MHAAAVSLPNCINGVAGAHTPPMLLMVHSLHQSCQLQLVAAPMLPLAVSMACVVAGAD